MSVLATTALTIGALMLALGLSSSSRKRTRRGRYDGGGSDGVGSTDDEGCNDGGDGGDGGSCGGD